MFFLLFLIFFCVLIHELFCNVHPLICDMFKEWVSSSKPSFAATSSSSKSSEILLLLIKELLENLRYISRCLLLLLLLILLNILILGGRGELILIKTSNNSLRCIFRSLNFDKWMFMANSLFADFTIIEILADATFVSYTNYRTYSTSVTSNIVMLNQSFSFGVGLVIIVQRLT